MKNSDHVIKNIESEQRSEFKEGVDYYFEAGLMVLTAEFLRKRGYCCHNDCRHCPYPKEPAEES